MHSESLHEEQRDTCNHLDEPAANDATNDATNDAPGAGSSRARARRPARDWAFAGLLAEATMRNLDALSSHCDEIGLLTQVMP